MYKDQLFAMLGMRVGEYRTLVFNDGGRNCVHVDAIQQEDGSGRNFNVTYTTQGWERKTVYIRTLD